MGVCRLGWTCMPAYLPVCANTRRECGWRVPVELMPAECDIREGVGGVRFAFSRESGTEVVGDGQGVCRTGRRSKHWRWFHYDTPLVYYVEISKEWRSHTSMAVGDAADAARRVEVFCTMLSSYWAKERPPYCARDKEKTTLREGKVGARVRPRLRVSDFKVSSICPEGWILAQAAVYCWNKLIHAATYACIRYRRSIVHQISKFSIEQSRSNSTHYRYWLL